MNSNNSSQIDNVKTFSDDQCFPVTDVSSSPMVHYSLNLGSLNGDPIYS